uniref:Homeobox domain-containing protein n=1 Tax=Meloidogyne hapla TaxID=6305 RepID=A0A1I8B8G3_MELHA
MGKLTAIQTPQQPSIPSTSTTTSEQNNDILDWWKNSSEQQQQTNNSMINLMSQIFNDSQQKQQNDVDSFCTAQMAQIAQMMLSAQMTAAAQMASLNSENGRNGLLDLLGIKNEEETIINNKQSELDNNQELNKSVSPFEEPQAKKSKTERKLSEKSGNNEIKKNSQLNDNSDQNGGFNQNNSYGDFASVLRALTSSSASFGEQSTTSLDPSDPLSSQFPSNQITSTDDPTAFLMATMAAAAAQNGGNNTQTNNNNQQTNSGNQSPSAQQKRARTRIGDDHVKILRQYFDINNSPSEEQIKEMAQRTNLAEKVIKHWFRNTLFKERQRDKDSPYNFSIPPQMSIDLATYHKTGEAKIVPLIKQEKEENESMGEEERNDEENSKIIENYQNEMKDYSDQELDEQEMSEDNKEGKGEEEEEENIILEQKQEEQKILKKKNKKTKSVALGEETKINSNEQFKSIETVAADLLASIGRQQMQNNLINSLGDEGRINEGIEFSQDTQQLLSSPLLNGTSLNFDTAGQFAQMMFSSAAAAAAAAAGIPSSFSSFNLFNPFVSTASTSIDLNNILQQPTTTQEIDIINPFINSSTQQTTTSSSIPSCSSSTSINSINQIIQQQSTNNSNTTNIVMPGGGSSGRRANRTRFTDFQLRTMQEFFDKQAYPKDDDLEMLSKKLGLSPRVIVVWFQVTEGRFARTPSANFQCRVCGQVFQRYLELIQHQQRICCLSSSVKSEEQNNENIGDFNVSDFLNGKITKNENKEENGIDEENKHLLNTSIENTSQEMILFNQLLAAAGCSQINQMKIEAPPTNDSNNEVSTPSVSSLGQCPLCGLQFNCNDKLAKHISENHFSSSTTPFNLKLFSDKNLEENKQQNPLDLTVNNNGYKTEEDEELEGEDERRYFLSNDPSLSPTEGNEGLLNESSLAAALSLFGGQKQINEGINQRQRPQSQSNSGSFGNNSSKRFRTHLTPMQVFVMKSLFHDYKTPSMQECDSLGRRIGLTKRVVQVWFQNTRAKERKTGSSSGSAEPEELIPCCGSSIHCQLCDIPIGNNINNNNCQLLQEHIFTEKHLEKVKEKCSQLKTTIRGCSVSIGGDEQQNSSFLDEKREEGDDEEEKINENFDWNNEEEGEKKLNERNQSSSLSPGQSLNAAAAQLPYYALAAAAAAGGMPINGLLPPLLYDPLLFGTPISALKVPESVAQQIITDMSCGKGQSRFTQDGLEINKLEVKLTENFGILSSVDLEVGWGCQNCNNVFQQPELLQNHWKLICPAGEDVGAFKLIQTHYQCNPCQKKFGTQDDFCDHYLSAEHKTNCKAPLKKEGK